MSRVMDVNQWIQEWWREEGSIFRKQWEPFRGQSVWCFQAEGERTFYSGKEVIIKIRNLRRDIIGTLIRLLGSLSIDG